MFYPTAEFRNEERAKYIEKQKQRRSSLAARNALDLA